MPTTTMAVSTSQNTSSTQAINENNTFIGEKLEDEKANVNGHVPKIKNGAASIVSNLLQGENCSPKPALNSPISIRTNDADLKVKSPDTVCLNTVTSSNSFLNNSNGQILVEQVNNMTFHGSSSENSSMVVSDWSTGDDNNSNNPNSFGNFSSNNNGHVLKRSIVNPQIHHGLSPNNNAVRSNFQQQQQFIHSNKNNSNSGSNFPQWSSNSVQNSSWQNQIPLLQPATASQAPVNQPWNRGVRSGNQLNAHVLNQNQFYQRKQYPISSAASGSSGQQLQERLSPNMTNSPKYRRNTSYQSKNQLHGYNMDTNALNEDQAYLNYNVSQAGLPNYELS